MSPKDCCEKIKSEPLKDIYQMHITLTEKKEEMAVQTKECEKYNNQDQYTKYAKIQRSLVKMQKLIKISKWDFHNLLNIRINFTIIFLDEAEIQERF